LHSSEFNLKIILFRYSHQKEEVSLSLFKFNARLIQQLDHLEQKLAKLKIYLDWTKFT